MPIITRERIRAASQLTAAATADELAQLSQLLDDAARVYDASEHGPLELVATYQTAAGDTHQVMVNHHPALDWRVLDLAEDGSAVLVVRLAGSEDLRATAIPCAKEYAQHCARFHSGLGETPPITKPQRMRMTFHGTPAPTPPEPASTKTTGRPPQETAHQSITHSTP
jgi:hypothetical protein